MRIIIYSLYQPYNKIISSIMGDILKVKVFTIDNFTKRTNKHPWISLFHNMAYNNNYIYTSTGINKEESIIDLFLSTKREDTMFFKLYCRKSFLVKELKKYTKEYLDNILNNMNIFNNRYSDITINMDLTSVNQTIYRILNKINRSDKMNINNKTKLSIDKYLNCIGGLDEKR